MSEPLSQAPSDGVAPPRDLVGRRPAPRSVPRRDVVGAGQLARMMAAPVGAQAPVGQHTDLAALTRLAADCDVIASDHAHVRPRAAVEGPQEDGFITSTYPDLGPQ